MTNLISFDGFNDSEIRVTDDGRYSVYDVIGLCGKKNPRDFWKSICETFPDLAKTAIPHKFASHGQGQRETPVVDIDVASWIVIYIKNPRSSIAKCPARILTKGACVSEDIFRDTLKKFYEECGESATTEVVCEVGRADIVTNTTVIEVKKIGGWKQAVGQSVMYANCLRLFPEVALFGDSRQHDFPLILRYCTEANVAASVWDTADGTAFGFILGRGTWSATNMEQLSSRMALSNRAAMN
jgi:hypothetical protein